MACLLVAATTKEITPFLDHYRGIDNAADIDILITGIGLVGTTYALVKQVQIRKPSLIVQAGIAGCFDKNISLGSVVVVKQDTMADLSVMENKELKTMFDLGLIKNNHPPFKNGWLVNPHKDILRQTKLKSVSAVSVNHITTDRKMTEFYRSKFRPSIESMEGAALHYTGLMEGIPFIQLRSVSNYIGERNKAKWNMKDAVVNLNNELSRVLHIFNFKTVNSKR